MYFDYNLSVLNLQPDQVFYYAVDILQIYRRPFNQLYIFISTQLDSRKFRPKCDDKMASVIQDDRRSG